MTCTKARSDSPKGWPSPLRPRRSPGGRASADGSEGMGEIFCPGGPVTSRARLALPAFSRVSPLPLGLIAHDDRGSSLQARKDAVMHRPITKYLDYLIAVGAEPVALPPQRKRDLLLLRAIHLQSFGPMRPIIARGESPEKGVCTGTDIPPSNKIDANIQWTERVPIPCSPTPNCRGHPCSRA